MGRIYVDHAAMSQAADDFGITLDALTAELESLERDLGTHLSEWTGKAKQAYTDFHDGWHVEAGDMAGALADLRKKILHARTNYHSARTANLHTWKR
jgi:WXG100 family type VII secretion target